jgi:hypothetical protein
MRIGWSFLVWVLLSGWLLMQPPLEPSQNKKLEEYRVLGGEPVTHWEQLGAYDTAAACEHARRAHVEHTQAQMEDWRKRSTQATAVMGGHLFAQAGISRCVPADHIYPPRK